MGGGSYTKRMSISGSTGDISITEGLGIGTSDWDTTNLALDVNGHAAIRRNYRLYLGVNSNNYNSWQVALTNTGSTAEIWSQVLNHKNTGYGSSHFFQSDSNGFDIKTGALRIGGTDTIDSSRRVYAKSLISEGAHSSYGVLRITHPEGAEHYTRVSSQTGAIKITLPVTWTSTMLRMTIQCLSVN